MAERPLPLHQHQGLRPGPGGHLKHRRLHGPGGVVDPHRIQRHSAAGDQDPRLAGAHKAGIQAPAQGLGLQLQAGAHLAYGHVGSHRQQPPAGQGGGPRCRHLQPLGLLAQVPDPLAGAAACRSQRRIIPQPTVQAAGQMQSCLEPGQHIGAHRCGQAAA